jgi:hypothetical protein
MQVESTPRELRCSVRRLGARHRNPHARNLLALVALSLAFLSGCSTSGTGSTTSSAVGGVAPASDSAQHSSAAKPNAGAADPRSATVLKSGTSVVSLGPKLTRSASLDLRVQDISAAAARVRAVAIGLQALVLAEQIGKGAPGDPTPLPDGSEPFGGFGTMTLSVPSDKLETALDQLAKIGSRVLQRTTSAQDVTLQYVDTQSRLKTMTASVARVRALMSKAIDLGQVVQLEGEVSRREADLESLQSQMDALNISVERSTLAVSLSTPGNDPVTASGFLAGLRSGWGAFTSSAGGLLIAVGAVLPFAVFFALVGAPIWWSRSRRRTSPPPVTPAPAAPSA